MPRNVLIDNVKGILIFLVVFTHFLLPYVVDGEAGTAVDALFYFVFCFHMPFFVFISGYFSKNTQKARDTAFTRWLVPFVFFNTAMMLLLHLGGTRRFSLVTPVHAYWYLLALFVWRVLLQDLIKIRYILPLSLVVALLVGFSQDITNYLALRRIVAFLPFFLLGYYTTPRALDAVRRAGPIVGLLGLGLAAAVVYRLTQHDALSLSILLAKPYVSGGGLIMRVAFFALAVLISTCVFMLSPAKRMPILTTWGENSLMVYVLHRYATLVFKEVVPIDQWHDWYVVPVFGCTVVTTWALGRPSLTRAYHATGKWLARKCGAQQTGKRPAARRIHGIYAVVGLLLVAIGLLAAGRDNTSATLARCQRVHHGDSIPPVISASLLEKIDSDSTMTISFIGDLILLKDQVKHALDPRTMQYDFSPVFEHVKDRLRAADYAVGVLEVPLAGPKAGYSTSNFDDGIPIRLNGPDAWATAIKDAGIDLVTTANNHVFDRGVAGVRRTLDVLDRIGLAHVGTYRSAEERQRQRVFITEVKGVKLAFLAYTYGARCPAGIEADQFVGILASPENKAAFAKSRRMLADDIKEARRHNPDLIIALPHMGTQFRHQPDEFSRTWARTMIAEGVDVVLASHSHAAQPMQYLSVTGADGKPREGFVVYCPGNFVNCYTKHDGDAAAIVTLYVTQSRGTASVTAASIVPIWIQRRGDGQFCPIPVVDSLREPALRAVFSTLDVKRIAQVQKIVTGAMLGRRLTVDQTQDRYFYVPKTGYVHQPLAVSPADTADSMPPEPLDADRAELHRILSQARKVVVVGDSISEGTKNGGYSWIEPLQPLFPDAEFINLSRGGRTTGDMITELPNVTEHDADAVIVALGVNDVRYRDARRCAMTEEEYIANIDHIVTRMRQKNPRARFVMISIWPAYDNDVHSRIGNKTRDRMIDAYNASLRRWCRENNHVFIDATTPIRNFLRLRVTDDYLLDHIHPNADRGVRLYADTVLFGEPMSWQIAL